MAVNLSKNRVEIRGYVGRYVKLPGKRGDPARFDVVTVERFRTAQKELITQKNWHTVKCFDVESVEEEVHTGALVEVTGRMDTSTVNGSKCVEIAADSFEVIMTQKQRDILRDRTADPADLSPE